jgi:eukaryotic-like serine/threonine-protein kinase
VPLLNAGLADGVLYYSMPLVEGESLRSLLAREGPLPIERARRVLREVADALAYAHGHGVIHRDIKPDNVLVSGTHALVTDFGIARAVAMSAAGAVGASSTLTTAGVALGTPNYMAPEQIAADPAADHRVDIYALGCLAYECLTGQPPFHGLSRQALIAAHLSEIPASVATKRPDVPEPLARLVARCLEKDPSRRPATAEEVVAELDALNTISGAGTATPTRRSRRLAMAAAGALVLVAALGVGWAMRNAAAVVNSDVVAVLPFRVSGADPSLAYLREGMVDLLAAKLTGEGGPRSADPRVVISAWRRAGGDEKGDLPPEESLRIAGIANAGGLIVGSVVGTPRQITIAVTLHNVPSGRERGRASVVGSPDTLPGLIDALATQLLIVSAGQENRLTARTTSSLPALRAYLDGRRQFRRGAYADAIRSFQKAIDLDSAFALAGLGKSFACGYDVTGACTGRTGLQTARAGASRLSARDSLLLHSFDPGWPHGSTRVERIAARANAAQVLSDSPDAWFSYGDYMMHYGAHIGRLDHLDVAGRAFERAVELDSAFAPAIEHLFHLASSRADSAGMERYGMAYLAMDSTSETAPYVRWQLAGLRREDTSLSRWRSIIDTMPVLSRIYFMDEVMHGAKWSDVHEHTRRALIAAATSDEPRRGVRRGTYHQALTRGRPQEALRALQLGGPAFDTTWTDQQLVWGALLQDGDSASAAQASQRLSARLSSRAARPSPEDLLYDACARAVWNASNGIPATTEQAVLARVAGDRGSRIHDAATECILMASAVEAVSRGKADARATVARLDSLKRLGPISSLIDEGNIVLARLWESLGEHQKAADVAARRTWTPSSGYWATSFLLEARNAAASGQRDRAITAYRKYLQLRADPEPSLKAEVDRVRAELARLESAAR